MQPSVRIAIVTDIHHGRDHQTKKGTAALELIEGFLAFVAREKPDLAIDLGDRISGVNAAADLGLAREVATALRPIGAPLHHIYGNHDVKYLSVTENEEVLGQALAHAIIDIGEWRVVLWRPDSRIRRPGGFVFSEQDLLWLTEVVRTADRTLAIMSHVPVSGHSQIGNYYFQRNPTASTYPEAESMRAVLRTAAVPVIWVAGHVHWNTLTFVDGIPHLTLQSLTETFTTHPEPAGSWALLERCDTIAWKVFAQDPLEVRLPAVPTTRRWVPPMPPFDQNPRVQPQPAGASPAE